MSIVKPAHALSIAPQDLRLEDFAPDRPRPSRLPPKTDCEPDASLLGGVVARALVPNGDERGILYELLTSAHDMIEPIVHVYQVMAAPHSIRAWVYHNDQHDRLAFTNGDFEIVLYDIRPSSPTFGRLNVFMLGAQQPCLLRIPPLVVHGVRNRGVAPAYFTNMPTKPYSHDAPDKFRLPADDPRVPYVWS